jgi:hypothetical protein
MELLAALRNHMLDLAAWFQRERSVGSVGVALPHALKTKMPAAHIAFGWQWVFPSHSICRDPYDGSLVRFHVHPRTCWNPAVTSAQCRSCSVTRT